MTVDERRRLRLYEAVKDALGTAEAMTLMQYLPPVAWTEVATKRDLEHLETRFAALIDGARAELRVEMAELRSELRGETAATRSELRGEMAELRVEIHDALREQTTRLITWMIPTWLSAVGIAIAIVRLG